MKKITTRKLIGQVHLYLGLSSGLLVFIISITGCIYVFEAEIRSLYEYSYTYVKAENRAILPVSQLYDRLSNPKSKKLPNLNIKTLPFIKTRKKRRIIMLTAKNKKFIIMYISILIVVKY
jgi:CHAT domain-containing protein